MCAFHLPPRGRVPSTQSTIFSNLHWLVFVEKTKISKKEAGLAHLKRKKNKNLFSSSKVLFSESFYEATFSRVYLREDILCLDRCLEVIWIRALLPHKLCVATIELGAAWAFTNQGNVFLSPSTHRRWFPMTTWLLSWQFDVKQQSCPHWLLFLLTAGHTVIVAQLVKLTTTALKCCHFSAISVRWRFFLANCKILYARKRPYACF